MFGSARGYGARLALATGALVSGAAFVAVAAAGLPVALAAVAMIASLPLVALAVEIRRRRRPPTFADVVPAALVVPYAGLLVAFALAPLAVLVAFALATPLPGGGVEYGLSFDAFDAAIDPLYGEIALRTLRITALGTALTVAVGLVLAYWLSRHAPRRWRWLLVVLLVLPFWTSFVIRSSSLLAVLSPSFSLSDTLQSIGVIDGPLRAVGTEWGVQVGLVVTYLPLFALPAYVAFTRVDWGLVQSAADLGASPWAGFRDITLRLAAPGLALAALLVAVPMAGESVITAVLGTGNVDLGGNVIVRSFLEQTDEPLGSALALLFAASLTLPVALTALLLVRSERALPPPHADPPSRLRTRPRHVVLGACSTLIYLALLAPLAVVVLFAFNSSGTFVEFEGLTTRWFGVALDDPTITRSIVRSVEIGAAVTAVSVTLGAAAGLAAARASRRLRTAHDVAALVVLLMPPVVLGAALLTEFLALGIDTGPVALALSQAVGGAAVAALVVRGRASATGRELEIAALDLGAGPWRVLRTVTLPSLRSALGAAALLAFTFSFDDVVFARFTGASGDPTWPVRVFSGIRFGVPAELNATATMMLGVTLVTLLTAALLLRHSANSSASGGAP